MRFEIPLLTDRLVAARKWKGIELGTFVVLFLDLLATMGAATWGVLYIRANPIYIVIIAVITFGLFFLVLGLLLAEPPASNPNHEYRGDDGEGRGRPLKDRYSCNTYLIDIPEKQIEVSTNPLIESHRATR